MTSRPATVRQAAAIGNFRSAPTGPLSSGYPSGTNAGGSGHSNVGYGGSGGHGSSGGSVSLTSAYTSSSSGNTVYKDAETLTQDLHLLKRQYTTVIQDNAFLKAQLHRLSSMLKKKEKIIDNVLNIRSAVTQAAFIASQEGTPSSHSGLAASSMSGSISSVNAMEGSGGGSSISSNNNNNSGYNSHSENLRGIEIKINRLRSEMLSISVLTDKCKNLENIIIEKNKEINALRSTSKHSLIRELQIEAQVG